MVFGLSSSEPQAVHQRSSAIGEQFITTGEEENAEKQLGTLASQNAGALR
jgi:hypothetical protein